MNATGKRRLTKLADFLETADIPGKFEMNEWSDGEIRDGRPACGTAACALGWATTIPAFRRAGLQMQPWGVPAFNGWYGVDAGAEFFGISEMQSSALFVPADSRTLRGKRGRLTVASRIRRLVASK